MASGALLDLVLDIVNSGPAASGLADGDALLVFRKDCTDLIRRIALLTHLLEEIRNFARSGHSPPSHVSTSYSFSSWSPDLAVALRATKRLLLLAGNFRSSNSSGCISFGDDIALAWVNVESLILNLRLFSFPAFPRKPNEALVLNFRDGAVGKIASQFQCVTWKLEKALSSIPYDHFGISEEVQEQVELVRSQLRRAAKRYGSLNSKMLSLALTQLLDEEIDLQQSGSNGPKRRDVNPTSNKTERHGNSSDPYEAILANNVGADGLDNPATNSLENVKKPDPVVIPEDFICSISLELMRDPVIVATGQTYERIFIQKWLDSGNATCPKTLQKLENCTLTPNYVLRSLISQWCIDHNIEEQKGLTNGKIKRSDGSFRDVSKEIAAIQALLHKLSSQSSEEHREAAAEIRSLSKRSTDYRVLIAESGAIPVLVNLLTTEDVLTQENAVTSILNLSIYENNKALVMLAGAVPSIVHVLRNGSMEARENAAATLFSLALADENKIIIGASGAIPALVELLQNGSARGKKDAATALFNMCIYQGNKGRAVRAGIIKALLKMLTDSSSCMIDEALTIMSVLASHQEAKVAIIKASTIPVLIDLLRTGVPRNKENAAAIILALCKRDTNNLASISRLGAVIPLSELARSGTERAKRKATSLLEHLRKLQQP